MAEGEEGKVQGQTSEEGAAQEGTEAKETLAGADVQKLLSEMREEQAALRAELVETKRSTQSKIDKDIAREQKQREAERTALQAFVRQRLEKAGADSEELTTFEQDYGRFTEGLSDKEMAQRYKEMVAESEEERAIREAQEEIISGIAEEFEVEIRLDHPDLKKDDPKSLQRSALKLAKKLLAEQAKQKDKDALTKAGEKGELSSLGGGPGGTANPLAGITDPEELYQKWVKDGRKIPKASE